MKQVTALAAACLLTAACGTKPETEKAPPGKDISLQLYSLRADIKEDYKGTIAKVGEMGFTSVEAAGYDDGRFYGRTPEEFKADLAGAGLAALSSHTGKNLSESELKSGDLSEAMAWWDTCIAAHKAAGMKAIVVPWMPTPTTLADLKTYCEYYNETGRRCKENGMAFGYHNHGFEFGKIEDRVMYDYLLENTNPEFVFLQMDVYWVVRGGASPVEYFNKYPGRFRQLHVKDHKELGQSGMVGFDAIFRNTDAAGVEHLVVEVESYNYTPAESVKKSLDYLLDCPLVKGSYTD